MSLLRHKCKWCGREMRVWDFSSPRCMWCGVMFADSGETAATKADVSKVAIGWVDIPDGCMVVLKEYSREVK